MVLLLPSFSIAFLSYDVEITFAKLFAMWSPISCEWNREIERNGGIGKDFSKLGLEKRESPFSFFDKSSIRKLLTASSFQCK